MSYRGYVIAAYAVFVVVLLWDLVAPRLQVRQQLRAAKLRAARTTQAAPTHPDLPLTRD
jgi:heme exporter protein D